MAGKLATAIAAKGLSAFQFTGNVLISTQTHKLKSSAIMAERKKLNPENAPLAFKIANEVYQKRMTHTEGKRWLAIHGGFNVNTAADLIADFRYMMTGESFERTLGNYYATYFLQQIYEQYGMEGLQNALKALGQHIEYYEGHFGTRRHGLRAVCSRFEDLLTWSSEDVVEQAIIRYEVEKEGLVEHELLTRIQSLESSEVEFIEIKGLAIKRKNWIIALIKEWRGYRCQICGTQIRMKSGAYYVEAAHVTPKAEGGLEHRDNILILCPNHHKEFDWGEVEILERGEFLISLKLNGVVHQVQL